MHTISNGRGAVAAQAAYAQSKAQNYVALQNGHVAQHNGPVDELVALTFRTMRHELGVSQATLARRAGASVTTIEALEAGAVHGLPGWSELRRIIAAYAAMVHADLSPIENRLRRYFDRPSQDTALTHDGTRQTVAHGRNGKRAQPVSAAHNLRPKKPALRRLVTLGLPLVVALGVATTAHTSPQSLFAVADTMPVSVRSFAQASLAMITPVKSHRAEGLLWIDAADPRTRKADRLKTR